MVIVTLCAESKTVKLTDKNEEIEPEYLLVSSSSARNVVLLVSDLMMTEATAPSKPCETYGNDSV